MNVKFAETQIYAFFDQLYPLYILYIFLCLCEKMICKELFPHFCGTNSRILLYIWVNGFAYISLPLQHSVETTFYFLLRTYVNIQPTITYIYEAFGHIFVNTIPRNSESIPSRPVNECCFSGEWKVRISSPPEFSSL